MTTVAAKSAAPAADDELGAQRKQRQPGIPPLARTDPQRRIVVLGPCTSPPCPGAADPASRRQGNGQRYHGGERWRAARS